MDITPLVTAGRKLIEAYGDGGFRIAGAGVAAEFMDTGALGKEAAPIAFCAVAALVACPHTTIIAVDARFTRATRTGDSATIPIAD